MDENLTLKDIQSNPVELPYSVQVALQTIESGKLTRARAEVAERLEIILSSVNSAVQRICLAAVVQTEEEEDHEDDEGAPAQDMNTRRELARSTIEAFFLSSYDKTEHLNQVLHWLKDADQDLENTQQDEDDLAAITLEWVEEMEEKIEASLMDVETSIQRLHQLCKRILTADANKTKTPTKDKDGVWRWWRQPKLSAQTVLKIQQLHPPSVELLLDDASQAAKSTSDLCFMLKDMTKFLSCKKAMSMAFSFAQAGLQNMCAALTECMQEVKRLRCELENLKAMKTQEVKHVDTSDQLYISRLKTDLDNKSKHISQMKLQISSLEKDNASLLLEVKRLQKAATTTVYVRQPAKEPSVLVIPSPKTSAVSVAPEEEEEEKEEEEKKEEKEEEEKEEESEFEPEARVRSESDEEAAPPDEEVVRHVSEVRLSTRSITPEERPTTPEVKTVEPAAPKTISVKALPEKSDTFLEVKPPSQSPLQAVAEKEPSVTPVAEPVMSLETVSAHSSVPSFDGDKEEVKSRPETPQPKPKAERPSDRASPPRRSPMLQVKPASMPSFQTPSPMVQFTEEDLEHYMEDLMEGGESIHREMAAVRHHLSVDAQRTNLKLLRQAAKSEDISPKLYHMAKHTVKNCLNTADLRLAVLMRKYIAYKALMQVRHNLNVELKHAREFNDGQALRDVYTFLSKLEKYERALMKRFCTRQATAEEDRIMYLTRTTCLFNQIREDCGVPLILPYPSGYDSQGKLALTIRSQRLVVAPKPGSRPRLRRPPTAPARIGHQRSEDTYRINCSPVARCPVRSEPEARPVWDMKSALHNMELARKTPVPPATVPILPRLLEMDITQRRVKALRMAQSRVAGAVPQLLSIGDT